MSKKKKEIIRIIRKDFSKEEYTFVSNDIALNNLKNNESTAITNDDKKFGDNTKDRIEKKEDSFKEITVQR